MYPRGGGPRSLACEHPVVPAPLMEKTTLPHLQEFFSEPRKKSVIYIPAILGRYLPNWSLMNPNKHVTKKIRKSHDSTRPVYIRQIKLNIFPRHGSSKTSVPA